jgi:hypothetical protein
MRAAVEELFRRQVEEWPLLAAGIAALAGARTRDLSGDGRAPLLRHIPHRATSTTAKVDPASIAKRPCFLCRENLFPEQRGLAFGEDWTLLGNPFPIVGRHLTIVHREHRDQRIEGRLGDLLDLASALEGLFVLYNGPRCGASAPDHLHFQAGALGELPVVGLAGRAGGPALDAWGARTLLFRGGRDAVAGGAERALALLAAAFPQEPEPWVNVVAWREPGDGFALLLYPRAKHRPEAFHRGELTVSPAAIDLSGLVVTPVERDFERLTAAEMRSVFAEVTIGEETLREVVAGLGEAR